MFHTLRDCIDQLGDMAAESEFYFVLKTPEEIYEAAIAKHLGGENKTMPLKDGLRVLFSEEDRKRGKVLLERAKPKKRATMMVLSSEEIASFDSEEASIAERFYGGGPLGGPGGLTFDPKAKSIALGRTTKPTLASFFQEKNSLHTSQPTPLTQALPPQPPARHPPASPPPSPSSAEKKLMNERGAQQKEADRYLKCVIKTQAVARGWAVRRAYVQRGECGFCSPPILFSHPLHLPSSICP